MKVVINFVFIVLLIYNIQLYIFSYLEKLEKLEKKAEEKIDPIHSYAELASDIILGNIVERKVTLQEFKPENERKLEVSKENGFPKAFESLAMVIY